MKPRASSHGINKLTRRKFVKQAALYTAATMFGCAPKGEKVAPPYKAHLIDFASGQSASIEQARAAGANAVITLLGEAVDPNQVREFKTAANAQGLTTGFWIEVGRNEEIAKAHPEWLHTPQHNEWLARFPEWEGDNAAVYPWVSVNNKMAFNYHVERIGRLATGLEPGDLIFLNNVQGPPAGCGCGNLQCRSWDNSPGEKIAPSPYDHSDVYFTAVFIEAIKKNHPSLGVIPIICPECERGIQVGQVNSPEDQTEYCSTINCSDPCALFYYPGLARSLSSSGRVGLLCAYKALMRDLPIYGGTAAWVSANIERYGNYGQKDRLIAVLQGWGVSQHEIQEQVRQVDSQKINGYIISNVLLDQSFKPVASTA